MSSAAGKLRSLSPEVYVVEVSSKLDERNAAELFVEADVVVDVLDDFRARFVVNEACVRSSKPYVYAVVTGFEGRLMTILPGRGPCLRCFLPSAPLSLE